MTASPNPAPPPSANGATATDAATGKHAAEPSLGQLVADASTHLSSLVHDEIELAKLELRATFKNIGIGTVLFILAGAVALYSLTFGFFALAEGLAAAGLDRWLAFLIVFGLLLLVAVACVLIGVKLVKKAHAPEQTIRTTKETVDYLKKSRG